jgi:hypothetical protein
VYALNISSCGCRRAGDDDGRTGDCSTTTATETKAFEIVAVDGNTLVVKLPEGTREIKVPADFQLMVDAKPRRSVS